MWLEVMWAGQHLPGGSARCPVPLSAGREPGTPLLQEPGTPLLQPPASAPLDNPGCFPSKVCVPQRCLCLLSSLPSFLSPFSCPFSPLSLPSALHESLSSGLCTKLRSPHLCFWTCPCIQVTVGSRPPIWAMLVLGRARGAHPAALSCLLPPCGMRGRARSPGDALQARQRELEHRESHEEGPRVLESPGGGSETPMERPKEQGEVLGGLRAHRETRRIP